MAGKQIKKQFKVLQECAVGKFWPCNANESKERKGQPL